MFKHPQTIAQRRIQAEKKAMQRADRIFQQTGRNVAPTYLRRGLAETCVQSLKGA